MIRRIYIDREGLGAMSRRVTQVVLLCEDSQHETFARRFLELLGVHRRAVRVEKAPKGRGSGEQWVREAYPKEVKALRSKRYIEGRALLVIIDEDTQSTGARTVGLGQALKDHDLSDRPRDEAIIHVIPARNIETWITYLAGQDVNETTAYPKLDRPGNCADLVLCGSGTMSSFMGIWI
jgi:hypothetical protein